MFPIHIALEKTPSIEVSKDPVCKDTLLFILLYRNEQSRRRVRSRYRKRTKMLHNNTLDYKKYLRNMTYITGPRYICHVWHHPEHIDKHRGKYYICTTLDYKIRKLEVRALSCGLYGASYKWFDHGITGPSKSIPTLNVQAGLATPGIYPRS